MSANESAKSGEWWSSLWLLFVIWAVIHWLGDPWHSKLRYSIQYGVERSRVTIGKQPHNCEWLTAPIGDKNCHYDAEVQVIRTGHRETTGERVVSYDDGKTWVEDTNVPPLSPSVYVTWQKIED